MQARFSSLAFSFSYKITPPRGVLPCISHTGTCLPKGYGFAPFRSDNGYKFCPFWSGIGYRFPVNYRSLKVFVISLPKRIWKKREYVTSKCILRNLFYWCSNLSNREIKHRVYGKRQTWICTTWPSFLFTCRLQFIIIARKSVTSRQFYA